MTISTTTNTARLINTPPINVLGERVVRKPSHASVGLRNTPFSHLPFPLGKKKMRSVTSPQNRLGGSDYEMADSVSMDEPEVTLILNTSLTFAKRSWWSMAMESLRILGPWQSSNTH